MVKTAETILRFEVLSDKRCSGQTEQHEYRGDPIEEGTRMFDQLGKLICADCEGPTRPVAISRERAVVHCDSCGRVEIVEFKNPPRYPLDIARQGNL